MASLRSENDPPVTTIYFRNIETIKPYHASYHFSYPDTVVAHPTIKIKINH